MRMRLLQLAVTLGILLIILAALGTQLASTGRKESSSNVPSSTVVSSHHSNTVGSTASTANRTGDTKVVHVPGDYASIGAAISALPPEAKTVVVAPGVYANFTLSKPVQVVGAGDGQTVILGPILVQSVNRGGLITGVTVQNLGSDAQRWAVWIGNSTGIAIENVTIASDEGGIGIFGGTGHTISSDKIESCGNHSSPDPTSSLAAIYVAGFGDKISDNRIASRCDGITVEGSGFFVSSNTIQDNRTGIQAFGGQNSVISNNSISRLGIRQGLTLDGIYVADTNSTVSNNLVTAADYGVFVSGTNNSVTNNSISSCDHGYVIVGGANLIRHNKVNATKLGIQALGGGNTLVSNIFLKNQVQAEDNGYSNQWWTNGKGNYWSDWTSPDTDGDGVVDRPYAIRGTAGSTDQYPLVTPPG